MSKVLIAGVSKMKKNLDIVMISSVSKMVTGMGIVAQIIKKQSMDNTPVQYGFLRASHRTKVTTKGTRVTAVIAVGGTGHPITRTVKGESVTRVVDYALYVHEVPAEHRVGTDKFLSNAMKSERPKVFRTLKKMKLIKFKKI